VAVPRTVCARALVRTQIATPSSLRTCVARRNRRRNTRRGVPACCARHRCSPRSRRTWCLVPIRVHLVLFGLPRAKPFTTRVFRSTECVRPHDLLVNHNQTGTVTVRSYVFRSGSSIKKK
jgi:hypothetical protein